MPMLTDDDMPDFAVGRLIYGNHCESIFDAKRTKQAGLSKKFHAHQLNQLECFVRDALRDQETPFVPKLQAGHGVAFDPTPLAQCYFRHMDEFIQVVQMLSPKYLYNEHITVFIDCCNAMGLLKEPLYWGPQDWGMNPCFQITALGGIRAGDVFNDLVQRIRLEWRAQGLGEKYRSRCREVKERHKEFCNYEKALFENCARQVVLRVDLYYQPEFADQVGFQDVIADLNHLMANRRNNSIFRSMTGYIAKLEYGVDKLLHWHTIFFLDGSKRNNLSHVHFAKQIGEYWSERITQGRGAYWNSNAQERNFDALGIRGIGVINADELQLRENLRKNVIGYLCKIDQFLKPKGGDGVKLIRKGQSPKKPPKKMGRPRTRHLNTEARVPGGAQVRKTQTQ